jgi:hypothetical protein
MNHPVFSVNIWCGIINNPIIGPYFFDGNLKGEIHSPAKKAEH